MAYPNPPSKIVPFNSGPVASHDIGRQFDEVRRSSAEIIDFLRTVVRDDGRLRNGLIGPEQMSPELPELLAKRAVDAIGGLLASVRQSASEAQASTDEVRRLKEVIEQQRAQIAESADAMSRAAEEVQQRLVEIQALHDEIAKTAAVSGTPTVPTGWLDAQKSNFYATDEQSAAPLASDYAQVSIEWAEHMPDTIPPNILAINAITGQHWSSRWWATQSANAFGMLAWQYLGAWPTSNAPSTAPGNQPLTPGMMYFDTTKNVMMVWNGTSWQPLGQPQPGITSSLYYLTAANQTIFPFSANDLLGHTATLAAGQGVMVYLNGVRLTPDDGTGTKGDYTVNIGTSTVTLVKGAPAGMIAAFDALALPSQLAPSVAKVRKLKPLSPVPDGTLTTFTLTNADGSTPNVTDPSQIFLSLDGIEQEPVVAFTASGATLTFTTAPAADAYFFAVWLSPT